MSGDENDRILPTLTGYLAEGCYDHALELLKDPSNAQWLGSTTPEVLSLLTTHLVSVDGLCDSKVREMLCHVALSVDPEELFFELLDKVDGEASPVVIAALLPPFDLVLHRLPSRRVASLEWLLSSILDHFKTSSTTEDWLLNHVIKFVARYAHEHSRTNNDDPADFFYDEELKGLAVLSNFLLNLLALLAPRPSHDFAGAVLQILTVIQPSLDRPLQAFMEQTHGDVPDRAYQMLCYMVHCLGSQSSKFPAVYSPLYIFSCGTVLAAGLLGSEEKLLQEKGLGLLEAVLKHVGPETIPHEVLSFPVHSGVLFRALSKAMVFSTSKAARQRATALLRQYVLTFSPKGRHLFLSHAIHSSDQQGVIGYLITFIKDFIIQYWGKQDNYFISNLACLVSIACQLPKEKENSIFNASDQIISALTLIRFLSLKDPKPGVLGTGIWGLEERLSAVFLAPVAGMLAKSREYLTKELHNARAMEGANRGDKTDVLNINVGGTPLPTPKVDEEIAGLQANLNTLDFIRFSFDSTQEVFGTTSNVT